MPICRDKDTGEHEDKSPRQCCSLGAFVGGISAGYMETIIIIVIVIIIISSMVALKGLPHGPDGIVQGVVQVQNRKSIKRPLMQTAQKNK